MQKSKKNILILDGVSTSSTYIDNFCNDYNFYHLETIFMDFGKSLLPENKSGFYIKLLKDTYKAEVYSKKYKDFFYLKDFASFSNLIKYLKKYSFIAVLSSDIGIIMTEKIQAKLNIPTNDSKKLLNRSNKYLMQKTIKNAHLNYIPYKICKSTKDALLFYKNNKKIVLKELYGSSAVGVKICHTENDVKSYFVHEKNQVLFSLKKDTVLAEKYIDPNQIVIVNTITRNGKHKLIQCYYQKNVINKHNVIFEYMISLSANEVNKKYAKVIKYTFDALDALGVKNGPVHTEILFDNDSPVLLEINPRISGVFSFIKNSTSCNFGSTDSEIILKSMVDSKFFQNFYKRKYNPNGYSVSKLFSIYKNGQAYNKKSMLQAVKKLKLKTILDTDRLPSREGKFKKTVDFDTVLGYCGMFSKKKSEIIKELKILNYLEKKYPDFLYNNNVDKKTFSKIKTELNKI